MSGQQLGSIPGGISIPTSVGLRNGQPLSRREFTDICEALAPEIARPIERIHGEVVMNAAAVRSTFHAEPHALLGWWLSNYAIQTPGSRVGIDATIRLGKDHDLQPDLSLRLLPEMGGNSGVDADGYLCGPPELVIEIAASTITQDRVTKFAIYQEFGVREYLIHDVAARKIEWFTAEAGRFVLLSADPDGIVRSQVFPGLWVDPQAILSRDSERTFQVSHLGLASSAHVEFVQQLLQRQS